MPTAQGPPAAYDWGMKKPGKAKKRPKQDVYLDTLMWIHDGRRSWNRKPRKASGPKVVSLASIATGEDGRETTSGRRAR